MRSFIIYALLLLCAPTLSAQILSVFDLDATNFPTMKAKFYAFDANGKQENPSASEITVTEDGINRNVTSISCPPTVPPKALSSVLVMDVSGSMEGANIGLAKAAATTWVNGVPLGPSECAVASFDGANYLNQDYTTNRKKLAAAISGLAPQGGTDYDQGLLQPMSSGLQVASLGKHQRVIIFLTDGLPNQQPQTAAIIAEAQKQNCLIFAVTVGLPCPQCLKDISTATGAKWFENIVTQAQINEVYREILQLAQSGAPPCEITWQSDLSCTTDRRNVDFQWKTNTSHASYSVPSNSVAQLQLSPVSLYIRSKPVGIQFDTTVTITATNAGFSVTNITSTNPSYDINPKSFSLSPGQSKTLTVSYTPLDSSYTWTHFDIASDRCAQPYYVSASYPGHKPTVPTLKLAKPNGGEQFLAGSDTLITWTGIPLTDTVKLEYSLDDGSTWNGISDKATGGKYIWHVPNTLSNRCLVKILEINMLDTIPLVGHKDKVMCIKFTPDGKKVVTGGKDGFVNVWDVKDGTLVLSIKASNNSIKAVSVSPDNLFVLSGSLDGFAKIWNLGNGSLVRTFNSGSVIYDANFNYDATQIVTAGEDRKLLIWDAKLGLMIDSLPPGNTRYFSADFSPDGKKIVFCGEGFEVYTIDIQTNSVTTYIGSTGTEHYVTYSHNGQFIGSVSDLCLVWKSPTSNTLIKGNFSGTAQSIQFSPDDQTVLIAMEGGKIIISDSKSGNAIHEFSRNKSGVAYATYSPDGNIIATAHYDKIGMIWYPIDTLQCDTSDAVFSIVALQPLAEDVDLGKVFVQSDKDSIVQPFIRNSSTFPFRVDSIAIRGANASEFGIVSGIPPYTITSGNGHQVEFRFAPKSVGVKNADIRIFVQGITFVQHITGEGIAPTITTIGNIIDFGQVEIGDHKDTIITVAIQNTGNLPINFTTSSELGPDKTQFILQSGSAPFMLAPSASQSVTIRFAPHYTGRTSGRIGFEYGGSSPAILSLFGQGLGGLISVKDDSGYAGEHKHIPIRLEKVPVQSVQSVATNYVARIAYDNRVLHADSGIVQQGATYDTVAIHGSLASSDTIGVVHFEALLSDKSISPMNIVDFQWLDGAGDPADYDVETESGVFHLLYGCGDSLLQQFMATASTPSIISVSPNPTTGSLHIDIHTNETGVTHLSIMNLLGLQAATIYDGELTPGDHSFDIKSVGLPSGSYFLVMQTPTLRRLHRVDVAK
ncbi:MAG: choice-of-anchor D domain-containing protein [Ignavibacteriota bacterium]